MELVLLSKQIIASDAVLSGNTCGHSDACIAGLRSHSIHDDEFTNCPGRRERAGRVAESKMDTADDGRT